MVTGQTVVRACAAGEPEGQQGHGRGRRLLSVTGRSSRGRSTVRSFVQSRRRIVVDGRGGRRLSGRGAAGIEQSESWRRALGHSFGPIYSGLHEVVIPAKGGIHLDLALGLAEQSQNQNGS